MDGSGTKLYGHSAVETLETALRSGDDPLVFSLVMKELVEEQTLKVWNESATAHLHPDGDVTTGDNVYIDSSTVRNNLINVKRLYATKGAFAALKEDGSVVAWGFEASGGSAPTKGLENGVRQIASTIFAFAALTEDGSVVAWGNEHTGGTAPKEGLDQEVIKIVSHGFGFAALKSDNSIIIWGSERHRKQ